MQEWSRIQFLCYLLFALLHVGVECFCGFWPEPFRDTGSYEGDRERDRNGKPEGCF